MHGIPLVIASYAGSSYAQHLRELFLGTLGAFSISPLRFKVVSGPKVAHSLSTGASCGGDSLKLVVGSRIDLAWPRRWGLC
jgi:hypothetical protein